MRFVSVDDLKEGLVAANDILGPSGQCMVAKGTVITSALVKSLKKHNIANICVEDEQGENRFTDEEIAFAEEMCRQKVVERFYDLPSNPMMETIFRTALRMEANEHLRNKG